MELSVIDTRERLHTYKHRISSTQAELCDDSDLDDLISTVEILSKDKNLTTHEWTQLFLRRLNRTLIWVEYVWDNCGLEEETSLFFEDPLDPWASFKEDSRCIQEHRSPQAEPVIWSRFMHAVEFENELKRRQEQFKEAHGSIKTLRELCQKYEEFLSEYINNCISFHSTLPIKGFTNENVIQTVRAIYGKDVTISPDAAQSIAEKITIPLQSASSRLVIGDLGVLEGANSIKPSESPFIPSGENILIFLKGTIDVSFFLKKYRWSVILGDPGSGKTTLLRWILIHTIRDFLNQEKPHRLPILIRICELVAWLAVQPNTPSLLDYIGHHTWFGSFYTKEKHAAALTEFILHGHAILLFDGLDEVTDYAERQKIISFIDKFAEGYVQTPEKISVNDDSVTIAGCGGLFYESPALVQGNQIIVTSRMIGYRLFPLTGKQFVHFSIRELSYEEAEKFINNWFFQVNSEIERSIRPWIMNKQNIKTEATLTDKTAIIESFLQSANENIWSYPVLLSLVLPFVHRQSAEKTLTSRLTLYEVMVNSALASSFSLDLTTRLNMDVVNYLLYNIANYLHRYCPSGFVDTFDLKRLLLTSLKTFHTQKNIFLASDQLTVLMENFIQKLNANIGFVSSLGLDVYGFVHRTFQEYFVAMSIVNPLTYPMHVSPIVMSEQIFSHVVNQNFREPLALAIGCISSHCSSEKFDLFCISLIEKTIESMPVGVILLFDVLDECSNMVSICVMRRIFDRTFMSPRDRFLWNNLRGRFNRSITAQNFVKTLLHQGIHRDHLCQFLFEWFDYRNILHSEPVVPNWIAEPEFSELLFTNEEDESLETMKDMASRTLALQQDFYSSTLANYLLEQKITISEMHVSVISVIISLCGGIRCVEVLYNEKYSIEFDPSDMYRSTPLSEMLIEYFTDDQSQSSVKIRKLTEKCEEILSSSHKDDESRLVVDACVALICLRGIGCPSLYQSFACYRSFQRAFYRLKLVFNHLREQYKSITAKANPTKNSLDISEEFLFDSKKSQSVELAMAVGYERMTLMSAQRVIPPDYAFNSDRFILCPIRFLKIFGNLHLSHQNNDSERIEEGRHSYQVFRNHPLFPVAFVPLRLQLLFERLLLIDQLDKQVDTYENGKIPYVVLLSETLLQLTSCEDDVTRTLLLLDVLSEPIHRYRLEGYSGALINLIQRENNILQPTEEQTFGLLEHTIEELLEMEKIRCLDVQHILDAKKANLQLYTSSIIIACLSELSENRKELFKQAISLTRAIRDVYLKLLSLRHIKEIVRHWLDTSFYYVVQEELFTEMSYLGMDVPLLMIGLLVAMCMEDAEEFHYSLHNFVDSLWSRLQSAPANEGEARDQEVVYLSLRDVFCFKVPSSFLSRPQLSKILQMNSPILADYFETEEILGESEKVFLAQIYLTELAVDTQLLRDLTPLEQKSNRLEIIKTQLDQLWMSLSSSYMDFIFPHRGITIVNLYLQQELSDTIEIPFDKLRSCNGFHACDRPAIEKWLKYKSDKYRMHMAYLAVFLLIRQGDMIPVIRINIEEILGNSLLSPIDSIRQAAQASFLSCQMNYVDLKCIPWSEFMWRTLRKFYMNAYAEKRDHTKVCFTRFHITSVEALDVLLTIERKRIYSCMETNVDDEYRHISFFLMIDGWSDHIRQDIDTRLRALIGNLTETADSLFDAYLSNILFHIILKSWNQSLTESLVELLESLVNKASYPMVQQAATLILGTRIEGKEILIHHVSILCNMHLTETVSDVDKKFKDQTLLACLKGTINSTVVSKNSSENLQKLCLRLQSLYDPNSTVARYATACVVSTKFFNEKHVNILTSELGLDVHTLYLFMKTISICTQDKSGIFDVDVFVSLIDLHSVELIKEFVNDFLDCLYGQNAPRLDMFSSPVTVFLRVACNLLKSKKNELLRAIQVRSSDEHFRNALYCFYKKAHFNEKRLCIQLYSAFNALTIDFITMIFEIIFGDCDEMNTYENVRNADNRDCIEFMFFYLKSESMIQRYYAAKWLVNLASNHVVASKEVELLLGEVLNDPSSQQLLYIEEKGLKKSLYSYIQHIMLRMTCLDSFVGIERVLSVEEVEANFLEALNISQYKLSG